MDRAVPRYDSLVIGAGLCGAVMARLLAERGGERVLVLERRLQVGGNCRDFRDRNGITVHCYGSHIFHTRSREVWDFLNRFGSFNAYQHRVLGAIDGIITNIPFNFNTLYAVFPPTLARDLERRLLRRYAYGTRLPILELLNTDDPQLRFLAGYIYEKIYLHYTLKQWGQAPTEVDAATTARVPVCLSRDDRYFHDPYQGIPVHGYTALISAVLDHPGISVRCGCEAASWRARHDLRGVRIFCTGSIDEYFDYRWGVLPYRSLHWEREELDCPVYQAAAVVNYPCDYDFTRIHEYKYYLGEQAARTVIAREYPQDFVPGSNERCYPVTAAAQRALYERYLALAGEQEGLYFLGRLGDYRYYNMDEVVARAMEVYASLSH